MGNITIKNRPDVTVIRNDVLWRRDISFTAKGVYCFVESLPEETKITTPIIANMLNEPEEVIESAFNELVEAGYYSRKEGNE